MFDVCMFLEDSAKKRVTYKQDLYACMAEFIGNNVTAIKKLHANKKTLHKRKYTKR